MSFLNPVNEPVLRFSSTDADAPQINYAARTAGDVKAVLKACLVDGYGTTASAGWTAVNEAANVIEFVSPSAAMSDYRLGVDDTSAANTTWYYQYQDVRTNPSYNAPTKSFSYTDKLHADNGWQLLVTERGLIFIELVQHTSVNKLSARITYWGAVKSALSDSTGKNIMYFNTGQNATDGVPYNFFGVNTYLHIQLSTYTSTYTSAATSNVLSGTTAILNASAVDLISSIYLTDNTKSLLLGELPPMLSKVVNKTADLFGVRESTLDGRDVLSICGSRGIPSIDAVNSGARTFLIRTDYWEY